MQHDTDEFFVVTGGPGSGKTTLIDALATKGFRISREARRAIIKEQVEAGGDALPWADRAHFAQAMLAREIESYRAHLGQLGPVFFDRGIPDVIGYLDLIGFPAPSAMCEAATRFRYNRRVLIAPPWPEIFTQDSERKQTLEEAARTYDAMVRTYTEYDYELVELPRVPVEARARFVREFLRAA